MRMHPFTNHTMFSVDLLVLPRQQHKGYATRGLAITCISSHTQRMSLWSGLAGDNGQNERGPLLPWPNKQTKCGAEPTTRLKLRVHEIMRVKGPTRLRTTTGAFVLSLFGVS